jgi:hypothetical protein
LLVIILFNFVYVMVNQTLGHVLKSETCIWNPVPDTSFISCKIYWYIYCV